MSVTPSTFDNLGANAAGRLEDSGRQNDEKLWRETVHSQSYAASFRHSAVLSPPAVLLRKLPINGKTVATTYNVFQGFI